MTTASIFIAELPPQEGADGQSYSLHQLREVNSGVEVTLTNYGASILSVRAPGKRQDDDADVLEEVALCYGTIKELQQHHGPYYGCTAGRVANRINCGRFDLDGLSYQLAVNNGENHLHGGDKGFDQKMWQCNLLPPADDWAGIEYSYRSADGEEGYPGEVKVFVTYILTSSAQLLITYRAEVTGKATPINLTNHTYWNMSGNFKRKITEQQLKLSCSRYLPTTPTQIPTGELRSVEADPLFDFRVQRQLNDAVLSIGAAEAAAGEGRAGLDHCFVVDGAIDEGGAYNYDPREQLNGIEEAFSSGTVVAWITGSLRSCRFLRHVGTLSDPISTRQMEVYSTQPGVQIYSANWLPEGIDSNPHAMHNALCMETQHFPDAINQHRLNPMFPSVVLRPGDCYFHQTVFAFRSSRNEA